MKNNKIVDPNIYYQWIADVFQDFYTIKSKNRLNLKKSISSILEPLGWILYDWLLLLTTLEVKFNIDIPDAWGENMEMTLGELVSNLATLEVKTDKSYGFRLVMALGYQNVDLEEEKEDKTKSIILN